jgi:hypothetical protein
MPAKKSKKSQRPASSQWFVKTRGSYLPKSWQGILLYFVYVSYLLIVLIDAINTQTNFVRGFIFVFPQYVAAILVVSWIASQKS